MEFIAHNFVPLLFAGLLLFLLTGFPVAFSLAATGLTFGLIGMEVMGKNLTLNMESRGYTVAVYNRTAEKTKVFTWPLL